MSVDRFVSQGTHWNQVKGIHLSSGFARVGDRIGGKNHDDLYRFRVESRSSLEVLVARFQANVDVQLLGSNHQVLKTSARSGNRSEQIKTDLDAGTYYLHLYSRSRKPVRYTLKLFANDIDSDDGSITDLGNASGDPLVDSSPDLSPDSSSGLDPNSSLSPSDATTTLIATSSDSTLSPDSSNSVDSNNPLASAPGKSLSLAELQTSPVFTYSSQVSAIAPNDFFRFDITTPGVFTANLSALTGDADVRLIQDRDQDGVIDTAQLYDGSAIDKGEILAWQWERGTTAESICRFLSPGTYYLQVMSQHQQTAGYTLSTHFTNAVSDPRSFAIVPTYSTSINATARATIQKAIDFWMNAIPYTTFSTPQVFSLTVQEDTTLTGSTLANSGYTQIKTDAQGHLLPTAGELNLGSSYLNLLNSTPDYTPDTIIHEIAHALGIVGLTNTGTLINATTATYSANTYAGWAYGELKGTNVPTAIPLTTGIGSGSDLSHWQEEVFGNEVMTHVTKGAPTAVSQLTLAALHDLGWAVNFGAAQPYQLLCGGTSSTIATPVFNYGTIASGYVYSGGGYAAFLNSEYPSLFHQIQFNSTGTLNVTLSGLTANADMRLIYDANHNGVVDTGEVIAISSYTGTNAEAFHLSNLAAGTYYIETYVPPMFDAAGNRLLPETRYTLSFGRITAA